jgi:hypothetical protein
VVFQAFERRMTMWTQSRGFLYVVGIICGGLALSGYATFDSETWMLDISPFDVREFVLTLGTTGGNVLAAVAVVRGWGKKT